MSAMWWVLGLAHAAGPDVALLDRWLGEQADGGRLVGLVQVVDGADVLLDRHYGAVPADPVCRIGSLTKSFTAAAVYALADEGRLSTDDAVGRWLPEVQAVIGDGPSLRQLLVHQGGLSEPSANPWMRPPTWDEQARVLLPQLTVQATPGERVRYSNFGFTLLAAVVARAAGQPFEDVVASRLLEPLGMADTGITRVPRYDERLVRGRLASPIGLLDARRALPRLIPYDYRWETAGDGAFTSTPADLVRWARGLRDGGVLSEDARAALLRAEDEEGHAAGWIREGDRVWHNGALSPLGVYAYLRWSMADEVVVAFCGTPTVGDARPEWRVPIEAALQGEAPAPIELVASPFGWLAAMSTLGLHWLLAIGGVLLCGGVRGSRAARVAAVVAGAPLAAMGLGLTHGALGLLGFVLALGAAAWRWRRDPPEVWGRAAWGALLPALVVGGLAALVLGLTLLLSFLVEAVWTLG